MATQAAIDALRESIANLTAENIAEKKPEVETKIGELIALIKPKDDTEVTPLKGGGRRRKSRRTKRKGRKGKKSRRH